MIHPGKSPFPESLAPLGFSPNQTGGHMARSMMLTELSALFAALPPDADPGAYREAIVTENRLGKPTASSRTKTLSHLVELYGLDPAQLLFRSLRQLASESPRELPLLAMLCAYARDPQLRHSFEMIGALAEGEVLPRERMEQHFEEGFPGRFSKVMKKSLSQNVNTTWTHCGHLSGRAKKVRSLPTPGWAASTYAMLLGYLLDFRGEILLESVFGRLVNATPQTLLGHLSTASARGWLRLRHAGGIVEIDFSQHLVS
jgi:hypothetical protein